MRSLSTIIAIPAIIILATLATAGTLVNQQPVSGGGVNRWSQLWQDPSGNGNNLDGDAVCWEDFVFAAPHSISRIEWWGNGACELGFQIEIWKQDPNTIAYQPQSVWWYGYYGQGSPPVQPVAMFRVTPGQYTTSGGPGGLTHYTLSLAAPIALAANDSVNPRWFIGIVGLTAQAYYNWSWAQDTSGSTHTFQFIRGGTAGGGDAFWNLPDGRALVLAEPGLTGDMNCDGVVNFGDINPFVLALSNPASYAQAFPNCNVQNGDINGDGVVNFTDINAFVALLSH